MGNSREATGGAAQGSGRNPMQPLFGRGESDAPIPGNADAPHGQEKKPPLDPWIFVLLLLAFALLATTIAAYYTRQQWTVAQDQLAVMRNTEIRQLRAYLTVDHGPLMMTDTTAGAEIRIQHAGLTPAYKVRLDAAVEVAPYYLTATKLSDPFTLAGRQNFEYVALYGGEPIKNTISLPPGSFDAIRLVRSSDPLKPLGDQRFYIHGSARYLDIFGIEDPQLERQYDFCFVFHPDRDPAGSEHGCEDYNKPG
jgi:hypothetical protein